jgi:hypothetical protein
MGRGQGEPSYLPAHKLPCWLSSEAGADKAVCWDMMQAVYRLASASQHPIAAEDTLSC